jgi:glucose/arabinose dehydrogenase
VSGDYALRLAYSTRTFEQPVDIQTSPDGAWIFVVEQPGRILGFDPHDDAAAAFELVDLSDRVRSGGERGLLGLALSPDFATSGRFFVNYTTEAPGTLHTRVSRFDASGSPPAASAAGEKILLEFAQPATNHNGGCVFFDDAGYLYVTTGDGGQAGDPWGNAQDRTNLLGAMLRLDVVNGADAAPWHSIPDDNPLRFNDGGLREELFAWGLRNAWRASFDPVRGEIWAGDVGQDDYEEIDVIVSGGNYGWDCREGARPYTGVGDPSEACDPGVAYIDPVFEYEHRDGNVSVTGGSIYRGQLLPELTGWYLFADYVSGRVWALDPDSEPIDVVELADFDQLISSFGVDPEGEILVASYTDPGRTYRLVRRN